MYLEDVQVASMRTYDWSWKKKSIIFNPKVLFIDAAGVVWAAKEERDEVQLTTK